jgi:glycosyltransferase involved in cell wall biosynthesis
MHKRIAILWLELSDYINSCLRCLIEEQGYDALVVHAGNPLSQHAHPYAASLFSWIPRLHHLGAGGLDNPARLVALLDDFAPDTLVVSGWSKGPYRAASKRAREHGVLVIAGCDNPWRGTIRQKLGGPIARQYLHSLFDALWVPGERAAVLARYLGFTGAKLLKGLYSCSTQRFRQVAEDRLSSGSDAQGPLRFLFVGRFAEEKGIEDLLRAYAIYRSTTPRPWELWFAGSGPLEASIRRCGERVTCLGFLQPSQYVGVLRKVDALVLPSYYDPWPLVIHEATSAGLPVICSAQCGSSVELVQDGYNGITIEAGDVAALAGALTRISSSGTDVVAYRRNSCSISRRYSPSLWAAGLDSYISMNPMKKVSE